MDHSNRPNTFAWTNEFVYFLGIAIFSEKRNITIFDLVLSAETDPANWQFSLVLAFMRGRRDIIF
jgi:hypothetical protein